MKKLLIKVVGEVVIVYRKNIEPWFGNIIVRKSSFKAPDFMIIGAAKAGTTSLFQYLSQHPEIVPTSKKELQYFGMWGSRKGLKWYLSNFPAKDKMEGKMTFEATPTYLYKKQSPKKIKILFPNMKFIAILRDPVNRTFSHWNFYQKHSQVPDKHLLDKRSFSDAVYEEINNPHLVGSAHKYLDRGLYAQQLKEWYKYFNPKQILLIDFDEFKENPKKTLKNIAEFLKIKNIYDDFRESEEEIQGLLETRDLENNRSLKTYNVSHYREKMDEDTAQLLKEYFAKPNQELKELTGRSFRWMF